MMSLWHYCLPCQMMFTGLKYCVCTSLLLKSLSSIIQNYHITLLVDETWFLKIINEINHTFSYIVLRSQHFTSNALMVHHTWSKNALYFASWASYTMSMKKFQPQLGILMGTL